MRRRRRKLEPLPGTDPGSLDEYKFQDAEPMMSAFDALSPELRNLVREYGLRIVWEVRSLDPGSRELILEQWRARRQAEALAINVGEDLRRGFESAMRRRYSRNSATPRSG